MKIVAGIWGDCVSLVLYWSLSQNIERNDDLLYIFLRLKRKRSIETITNQQQEYQTIKEKARGQKLRVN